jgi:hypothetical protein
MMPAAKKKPEGKIKEIKISHRVGGKIQVVKYEFMADFGYGVEQVYEVDGLTDIEAAAFREEKLTGLKDHLEEFNQANIDELEALRDKIRNRDYEDIDDDDDE